MRICMCHTPSPKKSNKATVRITSVKTKPNTSIFTSTLFLATSLLPIALPVINNESNSRKRPFPCPYRCFLYNFFCTNSSVKLDNCSLSTKFRCIRTIASQDTAAREIIIGYSLSRLKPPVLSLGIAFSPRRQKKPRYLNRP